MILIHPHGRKMRNGQVNPKSYPHWAELLPRLVSLDHVAQIGLPGETPLVDDFVTGLSLREISALLRFCTLWLSIDSFMPHLAHHIPKPGVVLWGPSDPIIYGYSENMNLLRGRQYLRPNQFGPWEECQYSVEAFQPAEHVFSRINEKYYPQAL